jgi:uncharacterized membrane protein
LRETVTRSAPHDATRLTWPAFWLGFALSGFFDGILLHQILQWHHLLSAIRGDDIRFQILMDGYFHLLMYVVAALGLWFLWRARHAFEAAGASRRFLAYVLIGFGVWHFLDAFASHWVLGVHRIKQDAANPLLWDVGWLIAFGATPLLIGWLLRKGGPPGRHRPKAVVALTALIILGAGYWAGRPPPGQPFTTIVFAPNVSEADALGHVLARTDALAWFDGAGVYVVTGVSQSEAFELYARGALLVAGAGAPAGCFGWSSAARSV